MSNQKVDIDDEFGGTLSQLRKDDRFINFVSLMGQPPVKIRIEKAGRAKLPRGKECPVITFSVNGKEQSKRWLVTAKEVQNDIVRRAGTNSLSKWVGLEFEIYAEPNVTFGREKVGGVRIKPATGAGEVGR